MRILVITDKHLASLSDGYDLRVWHLCRELAYRHDLHLLTIPLDPLSSCDSALLGSSTIFSEVTNMPPLPSDRPSLRRHFRRNESNYVPLAYPRHYSMVTRTIAAICDERHIDCILAFNLDLAGFVRPFSGTKKILFDLCDSEFLTLSRQIKHLSIWPLSEFAKAHLMKTRFAKAESCLPRWFSHVTTINRADTEAVCRLSSGAANVSTIPNGISPDLVKTFDTAYPRKKRRGVAFWGNLAFKPNSDAVRYFFDKVYRPHLAPARIEWCVIGRDAEGWLLDEARRDSNIRLTGFVEDIYSVLLEYPIMVNPMRIGSGLKNKVLEAFGMGLAVVSTRLGIEAISTARSGVDYMQADEPEGMVAAINELMESDCLRLSIINNARNVLLEHYTWNKVAGDMDAILCSL